MPDSCCAYGCTNRDTKETREKGMSFHAIPANPTRREAWIKAIRRKKWEPGNVWRYLAHLLNCTVFILHFVLGPGAKLCSTHFQPGDFDELTTRKKLKTSAVPSVFPAFPSYYQAGPKEKRRKIEKAPLPPRVSQGTSLSILKETINHDHIYCQTGISILQFFWMQAYK